jgi:hypothetical protein
MGTKRRDDLSLNLTLGVFRAKSVPLRTSRGHSPRRVCRFAFGRLRALPLLVWSALSYTGHRVLTRAPCPRRTPAPAGLSRWFGS